MHHCLTQGPTQPPRSSCPQGTPFRVRSAQAVSTCAWIPPHPLNTFQAEWKTEFTRILIETASLSADFCQPLSLSPSEPQARGGGGFSHEVPRRVCCHTWHLTHAEPLGFPPQPQCQALHGTEAWQQADRPTLLFVAVLPLKLVVSPFWAPLLSHALSLRVSSVVLPPASGPLHSPWSARALLLPHLLQVFAESSLSP